MPSTVLTPPVRSATPSRVVAGLLVLASIVTAVVLDIRHPDVLLRLIPSTDMRELHVDFDTFWHSAVAMVNGTDIYDTPAKLRNLNPPLMTVLLGPFAPMDEVTAYRIWVVLTTLMVAGSILAVARELRLRAAFTVPALLAVLASSPLHGTLVLGQIYPLLLVGLVAGWLAERRGHPVWAAVFFGITVALKPSLAPILLLPAVQRRWVPLRSGILAAAVATLVGVALAGPSSAWGWLRIAFSEPVPDSVDNASIPGLMVRFALATGVSPVLAGAAGFLLGAVVLVGTLYWFGRHRDRVDPAGPAVFAVVAASLLFSPIAWHNYLMLLWPGVFFLLTIRKGPAVAAMLAVAVIPVSWNAEWPPAGIAPAAARSLYFLILTGYWLVLSRSAVAPLVAESITEESITAESITTGPDAAVSAPAAEVVAD